MTKHQKVNTKCVDEWHIMLFFKFDHYRKNNPNNKNNKKQKAWLIESTLQITCKPLNIYTIAEYFKALYRQR